MYQPMKEGRDRARRMVERAGYKVGGDLGGKTDAESDIKMIKKAFNEHDKQLHGGKKTRLHLADGGMASDRLDRRPRSAGKDQKHGNQINIAVMPNRDRGATPPAGPPAAAAPPPPHPPMPPPAPPPGAMPPLGAMPPGGMPPGMPPRPPMVPPGAPPMRPPGMNRGGRPRRQMGGPGMPMPAVPPAGMPPQAAMQQPMARPPMPPQAAPPAAMPAARPPMAAPPVAPPVAPQAAMAAARPPMYKRGGKMDAGAGSGEGRLEKAGMNIND